MLRQLLLLASARAAVLALLALALLCLLAAGVLPSSERTTLSSAPNAISISTLLLSSME